MSTRSNDMKKNLAREEARIKHEARCARRKEALEGPTTKAECASERSLSQSKYSEDTQEFMVAPPRSRPPKRTLRPGTALFADKSTLSEYSCAVSAGLLDWQMGLSKVEQQKGFVDVMKSRKSDARPRLAGQKASRGEKGSISPEVFSTQNH